MWFKSLTGFREEDAEQVRRNITVEGERMTSVVNGRELVCGRLETPSLMELRERLGSAPTRGGRLRLSEVVADVAELHADPENAGALFQVASQFNLLEMVSPSMTPEHGVEIYAHDRTQGPACAIACGAGTIYRNYFVPLNGRLGQTHDNQIDCLRDLGAALGNDNERLWTMRNGYALASEEGLLELDDKLSSASEAERDGLREKLRIGLHWNTQVTLRDAAHTVSQAYGSAVPVAYSPLSPDLWESFATLVLEASSEAALCAAALNARGTGIKKVFLTLLGGGAFGNSEDWILRALERALRRFEHVDVDLDVAIVSYGSSNHRVREAAARWGSAATGPS